MHHVAVWDVSSLPELNHFVAHPVAELRSIGIQVLEPPQTRWIPEKRLGDNVLCWWYVECGWYKDTVYNCIYNCHMLKYIHPHCACTSCIAIISWYFLLPIWPSRPELHCQIHLGQVYSHTLKHAEKQQSLQQASLCFTVLARLLCDLWHSAIHCV